MPVRKRSGLAACHQASIHDLPAPLLAHIFSFIERRDVLSVLLVSNTWLAAAEEHCAALWDELWLHSDRVCLEGALAKKEFQAVFKKRAASMSTTLHVRGRTEAFTGLLSSLLRAFKCSGSRLRVLDLDVAFMKRRHYTACCKVGFNQAAAVLYATHAYSIGTPLHSLGGVGSQTLCLPASCCAGKALLSLNVSKVQVETL